MNICTYIKAESEILSSSLYQSLLKQFMLIPVVFLLLALSMVRACNLYVNVTTKGYSWGLWPFPTAAHLWVCCNKPWLRSAQGKLCSVRAEAQFPLDLLKAFKESRQGSEGMDLWPSAKCSLY